MNLIKILNNKDVLSGNAKFRPAGANDGHYYQVIPSQGGIIQVTAGADQRYSFIGITPSVELIVGDWEIIKESSIIC